MSLHLTWTSLDLVQHYFVKNNITALRRLRKTDSNRIARATGATIVNRVEEIKESDIGTKCGLFEVRKIGDEYVECPLPLPYFLSSAMMLPFGVI